MAKMRPPIIPEQPVPVLSDDQVRGLLAVCSGKDFRDRRDTAIIRLFLDTGMRLESMGGLRYRAEDDDSSDVELRSRVVRIIAKGCPEMVLPIGTKAARDIDRYIRARAAHPHAADRGYGSARIHRVIWTLELRPSLLRMLVMWVSTVRSDRNRVAAIWRLLRSSATRRAISFSRRVRTVRGSVLPAVGGFGRGRLLSIANAIPSLIVIARPWAKAVSKARWPIPRMAAATV